MKFKKSIQFKFRAWRNTPFTWFTIMGGVASALMYIQTNQTTCSVGRRFDNLATAALGY